MFKSALRAGYGGSLLIVRVQKCIAGGSYTRWGTRVSLSDWLAFQAGIRGFENPRLLRDRPADGAAWMARICEGMEGWVICRAWGSYSVDGGKGYEGLMAEGLPSAAKEPPRGQGGMAAKIHAGAWRIVCAGAVAVDAGSCGFRRAIACSFWMELSWPWRQQHNALDHAAVGCET